MEISILFAQRRESYEGQYAPEALVAWDEFCIDENPEGFEQACTAALASAGDDIVASRVVKVRVDGDKIRQLLVGVPVVKGEVVG